MTEPLDDEAEVIDGLPVLGDEPPRRAAMRAPEASSRALALRVAAPVQATIAALGGFLAGAAVVTFARRRPRRTGRALARRSDRRLMRRAGQRERKSASRKPASELVQVVASRSLLVDVHLLGSPGDKR